MSLTQENFDELLRWLDPDPEIAGRRYETVRAGLIRLFTYKQFNDAEDLADETISRVATKLPEIRNCYTGNPENYFHGVARNIVMEARKRKEIATDVFPVSAFRLPEVSEAYECLLACLKFLDPDKRELVLDYHVYKGKDKIAIHRVMASERHITENALRVLVHRIKSRLEHCVEDCMSRKKKVK